MSFNDDIKHSSAKLTHYIIVTRYRIEIYDRPNVWGMEEENKSRFNLSWGVDTSIAGRARTIGREKRVREGDVS